MPPLSIVLLSLYPLFVLCANDGLARTPPRGWRSWDTFYATEPSRWVTQDDMLNNCRILTQRFPDAKTGIPVSLQDLNYTSCGLDDGWQFCGHGAPPNSFHDASGKPLIKLSAFPNMTQMVEELHTLGLRAGWYLNNCICQDVCSSDACFEGDVAVLLGAGFDEVKLDGCGRERNVTHFYSLITANHTPLVIENCHNGGPEYPTGVDWNDAAGCPFHFYRSTSDLYGGFGNVLYNLEQTLPFIDRNLSGPGCWAYSDMLGFQTTPERPGPIIWFSQAQHRTLFGAWAIISSPLILGFNLTNATELAQLWPIISNPEVLAVNSAWAGSPGNRFARSHATVQVPGCPACDPFLAPIWQAFANPLGGGAVAVLVINANATALELSIPLGDIPGLAPGALVRVRDAWQREDVGTAAGFLRISAMEQFDSAFFTLAPALAGVPVAGVAGD